MTVLHALISILPLGALIAVVAAVVRSERRRRREEREESLRYKTGRWMGDF